MLLWNSRSWIPKRTQLKGALNVQKHVDRWDRGGCWRDSELLMCLRGGGPALLEVISVDNRGRVQRSAVPGNLPPWKIDAAQKWSDTCTYGDRQAAKLFVRNPSRFVPVCACKRTKETAINAGTGICFWQSTRSSLYRHWSGCTNR